MGEPVVVRSIFATTESWVGSLLPSFRPGQTQFKVIHYRLEPGGKTTIHMHPLNGAGYLLAGELTMFATEDPHGSFSNPSQVKTIRLKPGECWAEAVNVWHYGINHGKVAVEFILVFVGEEGTPPTLSLGTHP
jgi:quercetin dioxygenase-like cupin family protein